MANIKVSEMTEATSFDDGDYTMIVQANQNKKISKENMLLEVGKLSNLETTNKSNIVNSINEVNNIATNNAKDNIYSLNEIDTGKTWIDGKPIYRKTLFISALPNATTILYDTTVTNLREFIYLYGRASGGLIINGARPDSSSLEIGAWYDETQDKIRVATGIDRSNMSAYITILYTKSTD